MRIPIKQFSHNPDKKDHTPYFYISLSIEIREITPSHMEHTFQLTHGLGCSIYMCLLYTYSEVRNQLIVLSDGIKLIQQLIQVLSQYPNNINLLH